MMMNFFFIKFLTFGFQAECRLCAPNVPENFPYNHTRVSWVTPKMSQNFDLMYFNKIEKSHSFANNE